MNARVNGLNNQEVILNQMEEWLIPVIKGLISELNELRELGITGSQFHLLSKIQKEKVTNVKNLAEELDVKSSAITVMLERLVQNDLVSRVQDEKDRRSVLVRLTDEGEEVLKKGKIHSKEVLLKYASLLDDDELRVIYRVLRKLAVYQTAEKK
ncbi:MULTISPECIES: MarR family winged helix-turn-helix transcriptional regulator [Bacillaceae]|uniref:MarR family winged helix-turn-helix transcriptional regulator n=1 Tax=Bacillaceae TaxID=186817 RepID=UPI000670D63C|nr:MarR family transcriptional regulator [Bacillus sp. FJAT-27916]